MNKSVDLNAALRHPFDDESRVTKIVLGALLLFVPIVNFVVFGYEIQVVRNVRAGQARPMPEWSDFGKFFSDGLILGLARLIYGLPVLLLMAPFFSVFLLPIFIAILAGNSDSRTLDRLMGTAFAGGMLLGLLGLAVAMLYGLAVGFAMPAVAANYIKRGTFAACFDVKAIFAFMRANFNNYLMVWVTSLIVTVGLVAVATIVNLIPCIGFLIYLPVMAAGSFYSLMAGGHALGQAMALEEAPAAA